jgi:putative transposase of IS4/5 family DUF4096
MGIQQPLDDWRMFTFKPLIPQSEGDYRLEHLSGTYKITASGWKLIEPILRPQRRADGRGRPWQDRRAVLNGNLWVLGTGAQWRELPKKYTPYQTCYRRFQQWVQADWSASCMSWPRSYKHEENST